jgi:hypothetical protein
MHSASCGSRTHQSATSLKRPRHRKEGLALLDAIAETNAALSALPSPVTPMVRRSAPQLWDAAFARNAMILILTQKWPPVSRDLARLAEQMQDEAMP